MLDSAAADIDAIISANQQFGNSLALSELVAAHARLCEKFNEELIYYSDDSAAAVESMANRRPRLQALAVKNSQLDVRSQEFLLHYGDLMLHQGLPFIFSIEHLCSLLQVSQSDVDRLIARKAQFYNSHTIQKKSGGVRQIDAPTGLIKEVQLRIKTLVLDHVRLHESANAFRKDKSIKTNAERHLKQHAVYNMDLSDFFHSIGTARIQSAFENLGYARSIARTLAELCTYNGRLPMGAPTSPGISNIVASRMDRRLSRLAVKEGFRYTRYADDITLSFRSSAQMKSIPLVHDIIVDERFVINEKKTRLAYRHQRQKVTGIVVNDTLNVAKEKQRKIRAVLHNIQLNGIEAERVKWGADSIVQFRSQLTGHIEFICMVNPKAGAKFTEALKKVQWDA